MKEFIKWIIVPIIVICAAYSLGYRSRPARVDLKFPVVDTRAIIAEAYLRQLEAHPSTNLDQSIADSLIGEAILKMLHKGEPK